MKMIQLKTTKFKGKPMPNSNNIFRLFISSTFDDFRQERAVLQTKVFPKIKDYASSQGYVFQPIDLRWE